MERAPSVARFVTDARSVGNRGWANGNVDKQALDLLAQGTRAMLPWVNRRTSTDRVRQGSGPLDNLVVLVCSLVLAAVVAIGLWYYYVSPPPEPLERPAPAATPPR